MLKERTMKLWAKISVIIYALLAIYQFYTILAQNAISLKILVSLFLSLIFILLILAPLIYYGWRKQGF